MEIIHLILGKANPKRMNGVNKVVNELATKQAEAGCSVEVWGITPNPVHDYPQRNFTTQLFASKKIAFGTDEKLKQEFIVRRENIVVHIHGGFIPAFYTAAMFLKRFNIPFIITPHGAYNKIAMQKNNLIKKLYFSLFESKLLAASGAVHSLGNSEIDGLQKIFPNKKSYLIPYGFESSNTDFTQIHSNKKFIIGFCGRLDIYTKGLDKLVAAFARFYKENKLTELWIISDSIEKEELIAKTKLLKIENAVIFWGSKFGDEKKELLMQCDVFAHPSRNEGLPASVMEAASMGIPCLVSEATNTGDAVKKYDAGYVVSSVNDEKIYKGLRELHQRITIKNENEILRSNAIAMIKKEYNWQRILELFNEMYMRTWLRSFRTQTHGVKEMYPAI